MQEGINQFFVVCLYLIGVRRTLVFLVFESIKTSLMDVGKRGFSNLFLTLGIDHGGGGGGGIPGYCSKHLRPCQFRFQSIVHGSCQLSVFVLGKLKIKQHCQNLLVLLGITTSQFTTILHHSKFDLLRLLL